jgi:CRISPR system Cascade subunit CasD
LGVDRDDSEALSALESNYGVAVHSLTTGSALRDYHTVQSVQASIVKKHRPSTRRQLLNAAYPDDPETMITQRMLRQDGLSLVVLWERATARWSLVEIQAAMRCPKFVPYAGRKANVLGLPLDPTLLEASSLAAVLWLRQRDLDGRLNSLGVQGLKPGAGWSATVHHDPLADARDAAGLVPSATLVRRDHVAHRGRWQFSERAVFVSQLTPEAE